MVIFLDCVGDLQLAITAFDWAFSFALLLAEFALLALLLLSPLLSIAPWLPLSPLLLAAKLVLDPELAPFEF